MKFDAVVTGSPRSGTSLMMLGIRAMLGEGRIYGDQWPGEVRTERWHRKRDHETPEQYNARLYAAENGIDTAERDAERQAIRDMNPHGFWECRYTVNGIKWHRKMDIPAGSVAKIVSNGLARSDPAYIDRAIVMARSPQQVAKSQERLRGGAPKVIADNVVKHSPAFFVRLTAALAGWMNDFDKPTLIVQFDDLIAEPETQWRRVARFLGVDEDAAAKATAGLVEPRLKRSEPDPDIESDLWSDADDLYAMMLKGDWAGIAAATKERDRPMNQAQGWKCTRLGQMVNRGICRICSSGDRPTVYNFRATAERRKIDWQNEPCMYRWAYSDGETQPVELTIERNHWRDVPRGGVGDEFNRIAKWFRLLAKPDCKCKELQQQMNALGPDKCAEIKTDLINAVRENTRDTAGKVVTDGMIGKALDISIRRARRAEAIAGRSPRPYSG